MKTRSAEKTEHGKTPELIRDILNASAARFGDKTAFMQKENGEYKSYSYRRYRSDVEALGTELLCRGLAGKSILVAGENCYAWVVSYMAVVSGVGTVVPVDRELPAEEIANIVSISDAGAILCSEAVARKLEGVSFGERAPQILSFFELPTLIESGRIAINRGVSELFQTEIDPEALAVLLFTSGTTGVSKGVMLSNANITYDIAQTARLVDVNDGDTFFSVLPLHHTYECTIGFLGALYLGATVAFCESLGRIVKNLSEVKPTVMIAVPLLLETLYKKINSEIAKRGMEKKVRAAIKATDLLHPTSLAMAAKKKIFADIHRMLGGNIRLLVSGGAPIDPKILDGLNALGLRAIQGYGLTECSPLVTVNPTWAPRSASAGVSLPDGTVDIYNVQEDGTGEIRYKGKNVMLGYYNMPELTAEVKRGDWFYTGDLGYLDSDGYLYITGRKKNVIVTAGGKNIFPEELETYLGRNRFVNESVVVGFINDSKRDYDLVAVIHPDYDAFRAAYGDNFTLTDVERELENALAEVNGIVQSYKRMETFIIRETAFEKNSSRKIKRSGVAPSVIEAYRRKMENK